MQNEIELAEALYSNSPDGTEGDVVSSHGGRIREDYDGDLSVNSFDDLYGIYGDNIPDLPDEELNRFGNAVHQAGFTRQQARDFGQAILEGRMTEDNFVRLGVAKGLDSAQMRIFGHAMGLR